MKRDNGAEQPTAGPALIAGLIGAQAAAYVVTASMGDTVFSILVHGALFIGYTAAYGSRHTRLPVSLFSTGLLVLCLTAFVTRHTGASFAVPFFPGSGNDPNLALANLIVWFLVAFSFLQARRRQMIFVTACGLALFGLIGVINLEVSFIIAFVIFAFATVFAWSYDGLAVRAGRQLEADWQRAATTQAVGAAPVLAGAVLAAYLIALALFTFVPNPFVATNLAFRPLMTWAGALVQGTFLPLSKLAVGTGPAHLGEEILFQVKAEHDGLWKISCFDHYDGYTTWSRNIPDNGPEVRRARTVAPGVFELPAAEGPPRTLNHQEFWVQRGSSGAVLAAARPLEVQAGSLFGTITNSIVEVDAYDGVSISPVRFPGAGYEVTSEMTNWPPGDLRRAGTSYPPPMVQYEITDIPLTTQTALTPLVQQITASAPTPYDKAAAIQSYLEQNCFYTDQEPVTPPLGDSVVYFVLTTKRGACDVFSAAMTMMLRISGVPARVATGFVSGPADVDEPDKNDIRSKDAHAWVEVYFPGYGWVPFNPAPDRELEQQTVWTLLHSGQTLYVAGQLARKLALGLMAAVGLALFLAGVADPRLIRARLVSFREGWNPWERAARECTRAAATALAVGGLRPAPGETPLEMLERLTVAPRPVLPQPLAQLRTLTAQFYEARFGPNPPSAAQPGSMARDFRRLRKRLRRRKR